MDDSYYVGSSQSQSLRRLRTTSVAFPQSDSPSTSIRGDSPSRPLRKRPSTASIPSTNSEADRPEIIAPTPRRHLLESFVSQHWLRTPPLSPVSSRAVSPFPISPGHESNRHLSFSSLGEFQTSGKRPTISSYPSKRETVEADAAGMGRRWIRWMHRRGIKHWVVPGAVIGSTLIKWCIGLGSYSGQGDPPMFGDYEAQRHWMELTIHVPLRDWYSYDLLYWGLDYPPLTAYVSWACGTVGSWIEPSWFALGKSRGLETAESKSFMRSTVIALDALIYIPALIMFVQIWQGSRSRRTQSLALLTLLLQPALLLVDFGHFQYNSVMLGFTILALNFFATGRDLVGAVFFVLSLGFKQMALYYAPAIGSYLLAKCLYLGPSQGGRLFLRLSLVTTSTFIILFMPFLPPFGYLSAILDPIRRIFPFNRGLFEDKVANFWCASNVAIKWRTWASSGTLVKLSTGLTAAGFLPGVFVLLQAGIKMRLKNSINGLSATRKAANGHTPFLSLLPYALLTSSMSFFLFSFQVHEKTILLPLLPLTLLLSGAPTDSPTFAWGVLTNNVAVFSMWPLLKRDGLFIQYIATIVLWNRLVGYNPLLLPSKSFIQLLSLAVYTAALGLHILELLTSPPLRYPDLFAVLNVLISTPVFGFVWLWSVKCGIEASWAIGGLGGSLSAARKRPEGDDKLTRNSTDRTKGSRAASIGFSQGTKKTPANSSRASSVGVDR